MEENEVQEELLMVVGTVCGTGEPFVRFLVELPDELPVLTARRLGQQLLAAADKAEERAQAARAARQVAASRQQLRARNRDRIKGLNGR